MNLTVCTILFIIFQEVTNIPIFLSLNLFLIKMIYSLYLYFPLEVKFYFYHIGIETVVWGISVLLVSIMLQIASQPYKIIENSLRDEEQWYSYTYIQNNTRRIILVSRLLQYYATLIRSEERKRSLHHSKSCQISRKEILKKCVEVKKKKRKKISKIINILSGISYID